MQIRLLVIGKSKPSYIEDGIQEYVKRIRKFSTFELELIPYLKNMKNLSEAQQIEQEGKELLARLDSRDLIVALDENGKTLSSKELAEFIETKGIHGTSRITFVVGGAYGLSNEVLQKANYKLSLSRMTFSHQVIRLIFLEQLYRAFSIIHHLPYHHE